jgi:hypothetical protein
MNREKVKLIIKNIELLVESLKSELYFDEQNVKVNQNKINDYDEVFEDFD